MELAKNTSKQILVGIIIAALVLTGLLFYFGQKLGTEFEGKIKVNPDTHLIQQDGI